MLRWRLLTAAIVLGSTIGLPAAEEQISRGMADERYGFYYPSSMTLQELASSGVTVLSHTPATKPFCEEAHRWGVKVCPYVSLYKVIDSTEGADWLKEPFWKAVDASKHPEWFLRKENGEVRRPFDQADYDPRIQQSCCNHRDLMDAYERGVRDVIAIGADGVFVDNVHPYPVCYGPKLGLHAHDWPEKDNKECYKMALRRVCDAVHSYGRGHIVILNPGMPTPEYATYGDSMMWESFIWRNGVPADSGPPVQACRFVPKTWKDMVAAYKTWKPLVDRGLSIAPLTYLPDAKTEAENSFFAYACARLCGFDQWTATCSQRRDILRRLYRVRTGRHLSELIELHGVAYRRFERAVIVCNPSDKKMEATFPIPPELRGPCAELYDMTDVRVSGGEAVISLPPESGRVIVARDEAIDNLLREVEGQALAARLYLEPGAATKGGGAVLLSQKLDVCQRQAASLRKRLHEAGLSDAARLASLDSLKTAVAAVHGLPNADSFVLERLGNMATHSVLAARLMASASGR